MKAIAISVIHLGRQPAELAQDGKTVVKLPVVEIIQPGAEFEADDKDVEGFVAAGAARAAPPAPKPGKS